MLTELFYLRGRMRKVIVSIILACVIVFSIAGCATVRPYKEQVVDLYNKSIDLYVNDKYGDCSFVYPSDCQNTIRQDVAKGCADGYISWGRCVELFNGVSLYKSLYLTSSYLQITNVSQSYPEVSKVCEKFGENFDRATLKGASSYDAKLPLIMYMGLWNCVNSAINNKNYSYSAKHYKGLYFVYPDNEGWKKNYLSLGVDKKTRDNMSLFEGEIQYRIDQWKRRNSSRAKTEYVEYDDDLSKLYDNAADACKKLGLYEYVDGMIWMAGYHKEVSNKNAAFKRAADRYDQVNNRAAEESRRRKNEDAQMFQDIMNRSRDIINQSR